MGLGIVLFIYMVKDEALVVLLVYALAMAMDLDSEKVYSD